MNLVRSSLVGVALTTLLAGCGAEAPKTYGFYLQHSGRLESLPQYPYAELGYLSAAKQGVLLVADHVVDVNPVTATAAVDPSVLEAKFEPRIVVYFAGLRPGNVLLARAQTDVVVHDLKVFERGHSQPLNLAGWGREAEPMTMVLSNFEDMNQSRYSFWPPGSVDGSIGAVCLSTTESSRVDVTVAPLKAVMDAFVITPTAPLPPGRYIVAVVGPDAGTVTSGKGAAVLALGTKAQLAATAGKELVELRDRMKANGLKWSEIEGGKTVLRLAEEGGSE